MSKVSVIIPVYNRAKLIREAVESALNQTHRDIEVIVVDDGSHDGTRNSISDYIELSRIKYIYQENKGQSAARNKGIRASTGEYIALLDSDDLWEPHKVETQLKYMDSNKEINVLFCSGYYQDHRGRCYSKKYQVSNVDDFFELMAAGCKFEPSSVIFKKEVLDKSGVFKEGMAGAEDWHLWIRMAATNKFGYLEIPLYKKRPQEDSLSRKNFKEYISIFKELLKCCHEMNPGKKKNQIFRNSMARESYVLARKSMAALQFKNGLSALGLCLKINILYINKTPGLLIRYFRYRMKSSFHRVRPFPF